MLHKSKELHLPKCSWYLSPCLPMMVDAFVVGASLSPNSIRRSRGFAFYAHRRPSCHWSFAQPLSSDLTAAGFKHRLVAGAALGITCVAEPDNGQLRPQGQVPHRAKPGFVSVQVAGGLHCLPGDVAIEPFPVELGPTEESRSQLTFSSVQHGARLS